MFFSARWTGSTDIALRRGLYGLDLNTLSAGGGGLLLSPAVTFQQGRKRRSIGHLKGFACDDFP